MPNYWAHCGFDTLSLSPDNQLLVTDDFLRTYLSRPELALVPESCLKERAIHQRLLNNPRDEIPSAEIEQMADADIQATVTLVDLVSPGRPTIWIRVDYYPERNAQGQVRGVVVNGEELHGDAVVLAAGGYHANTEWRVRYLGQGWDLAKVRGSRYNTGNVIQAALDIGARALEFGRERLRRRAVEAVAIRFRRHLRHDREG